MHYSSLVYCTGVCVNDSLFTVLTWTLFKKCYCIEVLIAFGIEWECDGSEQNK